MKRRVSSVAKSGRARTRVQVGAVTTLRGALTVAGDIRSDVQFQNDVNALLATVGKLTALGPKGLSDAPKARSADDFEVTVSETPAPVLVTPVPEDAAATGSFAVAPAPVAATPAPFRRAGAGSRR